MTTPLKERIERWVWEYTTNYGRLPGILLHPDDMKEALKLKDEDGGITVYGNSYDVRFL